MDPRKLGNERRPSEFCFSFLVQTVVPASLCPNLSMKLGPACAAWIGASKAFGAGGDRLTR